MSDSPFNPLDMENLAHSIVLRMIETSPTPLGSIPRFTGVGLYAIYYTGDFPAYRVLAERNHGGAFQEPIYVGKGVSTGGRRGGGTEEKTSSASAHLFSWLSKHAASVRAADNIDIEDFWARWLSVEDIWIPLGESALIRRHRPLWNAVIDGFGNNDPGVGRHKGVASRWDTLHPGRSWGEKLSPRGETAAEIQQEAQEYLRSRLG